MKNKKRKGFTLPEILAVVAILILLVGIAVPGYERLVQRSEVSDALHNLDMLNNAQNKYFISNGRYTRNLSSLDTPLKSSDPSISTANFTYFAGVPSEGNNCIYSKSVKNEYTLAWNYKTHEGPLCSGSFCSKIDDIVPTGSLTNLCGTALDEDCDLVCTTPKVLDEGECTCVCENSCGELAVQNEESCACICLGQAILTEDGKNCKCPSSVEESCVSSGQRFNASMCDCTNCDLEESDCTSMGKVLNLSKCICEDPLNFCDKTCPIGKILNISTCECVCAKVETCPPDHSFSQETCGCECNFNEESCTAMGKIFDEGNCACACSPASIYDCSSPYQELQSDCSCKCNKPANYNTICPTNHAWDDASCNCKCTLTVESCMTPGYVVDPNTCSCIPPEDCTLKDSDCPTGQIVNTEKCMCENSSCEDPGNCHNGTWDYRNCECVCGLTEEYCKEHGNRILDSSSCECTSCAVLAAECDEVGKVLNSETCVCQCPEAAISACDSTEYQELNQENCSCSCNTPAPGTCPGHSVFNSDVNVCDCECNLECGTGEVLNEETCECGCTLDEAQCKEKNENYILNNERCKCECGIDEDYCTDQNENYTFVKKRCQCACNLTNDSCQRTSGNPYYGVNNETSCQCACSASLLNEEVSRRNSATTNGKKGPFWEADMGSCQPNCPITGDEWCTSRYGATYLADVGGCNCYSSSCNNVVDCPNGHFDYHECKCVCDLDDMACELQSKIFDSATCSCKEPCSLNPEDCVAPMVFNGSPFSGECDCECGLNDDQCYKDNGKVLENPPCECLCGNSCDDGYVLRQSDCECECNKDDNWCKTHNGNNDHYVFEAPCGCQCNLAPGDCGNSGNWVVNNCACECPASVATECINQGKGFDPATCSCSDCLNSSSCNLPKEVNEHCECLCSYYTKEGSSTHYDSCPSGFDQNETTCTCPCNVQCLSGETRHTDTCTCTCDKTPYGNYLVDEKCEYECREDIAEFCSPKGYSGCECTTCQISCAYPHQVQNPETCDCSQCDSLECTGFKEKDPTTCECSVCNVTALRNYYDGLGEGLWVKDESACTVTCPNNAQTICSNQGKNFDSENCRCTECSTPCPAGFTQHDDCSCHCDKNPSECTGNFELLSDAEHCACTCPTSMSETCSPKGINVTTCECTSCQISCAYPHQVQDPETCDCSQCDSLTCTGNWVKDPSTCDCTCPASVQQTCETLGKGYDAATCQCTSCQISCAYPNQIQDPNTCECSCDSSECPGFFLKDPVTCECNVCDKEALANHLSSLQGPDTHWMADDANHYCEIYCPDNLATICGGRDYDFSQCKCLGCAESCPDGFTQQSDCSCSCEKKPSSCVGNWELLSDAENCRCYCPASVQAECNAQNRTYNAETCSCGDCKEPVPDCTPYWTQNQTTCACSDCNISNSFCSDAHGGNTGWIARTGGGHCDCTCAIKSNEECAALHGGNGNWLLSQECECYCKETAEAECTAKGSNFEYVPSECLCRCKKPCSDPDAYQNPETCECTTSCDKDPSACKSPWVLNTDPSVCECECGMNNYECPGDWIVNPTTCDCSKCSLSNESCASSHNNNTNYVVNGSTCTCECGINSCPGENTLQNCDCVCTKAPDECSKLGANYELDPDTCTCIEKNTCNLNLEKCKLINSNYTFNASECECECGVAPSSCPDRFDAVNCQCLPPCFWNTEKCHDMNPNFIYNSENCSCECGLSEVQCKSLGKVLDHENCECVDECLWTEDLCKVTYQVGYILFNPENCSCYCSITDSFCRSLNSNWTLLPWCDCGCVENGNCLDQNTMWNPETCTCDPLPGNCHLTQTSCESISPWYILVADHGTCACQCNMDQNRCVRLYGYGSWFDRNTCMCYPPGEH